MTDSVSPGRTGTASNVEQVNLRLPGELKEYLEKLAGSAGSKLHPYLLGILEGHVSDARARLAEIYRRDAELAAKTALALDRQAATAERRNEAAVSKAAGNIKEKPA